MRQFPLPPHQVFYFQMGGLDLPNRLLHFLRKPIPLRPIRLRRLLLEEFLPEMRALLSFQAHPAGFKLLDRPIKRVTLGGEVVHLRLQSFKLLV